MALIHCYFLSEILGLASSMVIAVKFRDFVQKLALDFTYSEGPGDHSWGLWDTYIQKVLDWLPLPK